MTIEYQEDTYEFDGKLVDFNMDITTDYINTSVEYFTNLHAGLRSAFVEMGIQVVGEPVVHRRRA